MRVVVETGTDIAAFAVGDPTLLAGLRECNGHGFERRREEALASGAMWRTETGADGAYLFHVYLDEDPPSMIAPYLMDPVVVERLRVPSGRLLVGGEEVFVGTLRADAYPRMGQEVQIPPGDYQMTALRSEAAEHLLEPRFKEQATPQERRAWTIGNSISAICVAGTLAAVVTGCVVYFRTVSLWLALSPLLAAVALWLWRGRYCTGATYLAAEKVYRAIERELPSIVLLLRRRGAAQHPDAADAAR